MVAAELLVILAIGGLLLGPSYAQLREISATLPRPYATACLVGAGLLLAGHAISRNEATYPLVAWDMYTEKHPGDAQFVDYEGILGGGREERLLLGRLFPAGGRHLRERIDSAAVAVTGDSQSPEHQRAVAQLDSLLAAVAATYNTQHPDDSLNTIRLWLGTVPARAYTGPPSIRRHLIHEYRAR